MRCLRNSQAVIDRKWPTFLQGQGWFTPRNIEILNYVPDGGHFFLNTDVISDTWASSCPREIYMSMERFSSCYFRYSHELEMGTYNYCHIGYWQQHWFLPIRLHITVNCHKMYSILDNGYSINCHNITLNRGCSKRSDIFNDKPLLFVVSSVHNGLPLNTIWKRVRENLIAEKWRWIRSYPCQSSQFAQSNEDLHLGFPPHCDSQHRWPFTSRSPCLDFTLRCQLIDWFEIQDRPACRVISNTVQLS